MELHLFACHGVHNCGLKKSYKLCSIKGKVQEKKRKNMVFYQTVFFFRYLPLTMDFSSQFGVLAMFGRSLIRALGNIL